MLPIYVVNNYGQFNHLIQRMLRDMDIGVKMVPNTTPPEEIATGCRGVILGGGPTLDRAGNAPLYLSLGLPVLGICLGLHIIATTFGGPSGRAVQAGMGQLTWRSPSMTISLQGILRHSRSGRPMPTR